MLNHELFDDLDMLEKYLTPVRGVVLLVCGTRATRSLKAVVHRFRQGDDLLFDLMVQHENEFPRARTALGNLDTRRNR
jgi:hypothetical protein